MISTTYTFQGLEVKGQGSILASPALYKDEQNRASGLLWVSGSLEGSESRVEPEVWCQCWRTELAAVSGVSVGQSVEERELWWTSASGGRVPVGGESPEVGTREGARWRTRGLHGYHSWGKGYVETTARESLPAPRRSAERASTR